MSGSPIDSIAVIGDVADVNAWSGIPWHFWRATQQLGWSVAPWRLDLARFTHMRRWWNLCQLARGRGHGGYQYSTAFLDAAEAQVPGDLFGGRVLTFNQHFPRATTIRRHGGRLWHYIDAPLAALVQGRGLDLRLPRWIRQQALALERENFAASERIVCMASWAAEAVVTLCDVPRDKVSVVLPGANLELPAGFVPRGRAGQPGIDRPAVLGFVGKDWPRKGLAFLLQVAEALERLGLRAVVRAVGFDPARGPRHRLLEASGFIDKAREPRRFIDFLQGCDLGCLFSSREALGISTLEFLRVGVPVAGFAHEGMADTLLPGRSLRFASDAGAESVADTLAAALRDVDGFAAITRLAAQRAGECSWVRTLERLTPPVAQ